MNLFTNYPTLDEDEFYLLLTTYAKGTYEVKFITQVNPWFERASRTLVNAGLVTTQSRSLSVLFDNRYALVLHITSRGQEYVLDCKPLEVIECFINLRFVNYARYWIQRFLPISYLAEFLVHSNSDIREAAAEVITGEYGDLVFPHESVSYLSSRIGFT